MMHFENLDASGSAVPVFTLAWRIIDQPDQWSWRFIRFKASNLPDLKGAARVLDDALPGLFAHLQVDPEVTAMACALSSGATALDPKAPLARVGKSVAKRLGLEWLPDLFTKEAHRPLHSLTGGGERDAEVRNRYSARRAPGIKALIILDDLVTRGATFGEMARAMTAVNGEMQIVGIALGKNERREWAAQFNVDVNNDHVPDEWNTIWRNA